MGRTGWVIAALRPATLVAGGAFAVHQLSYLAGGGGSHALDGPGHAYLEGLLPLLAVLVALTVLAAVEGGLAGGGAGLPRRSPVARLLTYAAAILAVFVVQEAAEGLLLGDDVEVLVSSVGLVAVPLALGFGLLAWLAVSALEAVESRIAARFDSLGRRPLGSIPRPPWIAVVLPPAVQAAGAAPRAPPSI